MAQELPYLSVVFMTVYLTYTSLCIKILLYNFRPAKQLITEEKMAAHLNGLHISSNYTPHTLAAEECMDIGMEGMGSSDLSSKLKGHKIVLSEELKKIQEEPLLPAALIERYVTDYDVKKYGIYILAYLIRHCG